MRRLIDAAFGSDGLSHSTDETTYDVALNAITTTILPKLPAKLQQYFCSDVEPLLRNNVVVGCGGWTNNACESINHVLKLRTQWRLTHLPDLIEKLRSLVSAQFKEADRALLGVGDLTLRPEYARHRITIGVWKTMTDRQRQRAVDACFKLQLPTETSTSTDGDFHCTYRSCAGKKLNQRKRPRAERTHTAKKPRTD